VSKEKRLKQRIFTLALCTMLFALCVSAPAQQPKKIHCIRYLSVSDAATDSTRAEAIRLALRKAGYIEGQNITTEYRYAEGKVDRFPELAGELVRHKVDVIVVSGGSRLILAAKNATKTIPIVMSVGFDPVELGLVKTLARPGGNITGLTSLGRELGGKRPASRFSMMRQLRLRAS
jgi:putative ABC transport system substrate-binding protein